MKNLLSKEFDKYRNIKDSLRIYGWSGDEGNGIFEVNIDGKKYNVICSNGGGWEHISVSNENHIPSWRVMSKIKEMFFNNNEVVVEFHPAKKDYINNHNNCLHLWRCLNAEFPTPPSIFVGV